MSPILGDINRRDFIKFTAMTAAALGLSQIDVINTVSEAMAASLSKKAPVIWLEGQDCAGCTTSFASILNPPAASVILDTISLRYHESIMAASGYQSEEALDHTINYSFHVCGKPFINERNS